MMMGKDMRRKLQSWHEEEEYEAIIEAIAELDPEELDSDLKSQLGRALNNVERYEEALAALDSVDEADREEALWHFRRGYALYGLERYAEAREHFVRGAELNPEDCDAPDFVEMCNAHLAFPADAKTYRQRVAEFWQAFEEREEELRKRMDQKEDMQPAVELVSELLNGAFRESYFEMGHNGEKYELILTPEGQKQRLFRLEYWKQQAPEALLDRWNFLVGRPACPGPEKFRMHMFGVEIGADEVTVWPERLEDGKVGLNVYGEKLVPLMAEDENKAYSLTAILIDQCIGETSAIKNVGYLELLKEAAFQPEAADDPEKFGGPISLHLLRDFILSLYDGDVEKAEGLGNLCELFTAYQMKPKSAESEEWGLREDVFIGNTCCVPVISDFYNGCADIVEENTRDGVIFGFLYYNNDKVPREEMVPFRGDIEDEITELAGGSGQIIGGATGQFYSYIDCICYDLQAFLDVAAEVMNKRDLDEILFHVFRSDCGGVNLKEETDGGEDNGSCGCGHDHGEEDGCHHGAECGCDGEEGCGCDGHCGGEEEEGDRTGHFQGFVLLDSAEVDMDGIMETLRTEWGIDADEEEDCGCGHDHDDNEKCDCGADDGNTRVFHVDDCLVAVSLMGAPIPEGEAEYFAQTNYMWPEAVAVTKTHKAHLLVAVLPHGQAPVEAGKLFTKVASSCLKQENAIGIYTCGTVFQPQFYTEVADMMKGDEEALPVLDLVYLGLYRGEKGNCAYTYGLTAFGKDEIEVLDSEHSLEELQEFLFQIACYIIDGDVTLLDGETIGFTADQKLPITRSQAVSVEGESLKIGY